jgi:hypothetical protein
MISPLTVATAALVLMQPLPDRIVICTTIKQPMLSTLAICEPVGGWFNGKRGDCIMCSRHQRFEWER